jgi:hypothetical protein
MILLRMMRLHLSVSFALAQIFRLLGDNRSKQENAKAETQLQKRKKLRLEKTKTSIQQRRM